LYARLPEDLCLEGLKDVLEGGVLHGGGPIQHESLVDVRAQLLTAHVLNLLEDEDRAGDQDDGDGELADDQAFAEDLATRAVAEHPFEDGDRVIARENEGRVDAG
jgi:hypothetical protein